VRTVPALEALYDSLILAAPLDAECDTVYSGTCRMAKRLARSPFGTRLSLALAVYQLWRNEMQRLDSVELLRYGRWL